MKFLFPTARSIAVLALAAVMIGTSPRPAKAEVSFDFFFTTLEPYGSWIEVANYGYCWQPGSIPIDWSPYTDGSWAYSNQGWTWVSNEPWGLTYHYGRWIRLRNLGWTWVPGYEWAPAWVSFRTSDSYIGWAPLPPEAVWNFSIGFGSSCDDDYDIGPDYYNFCETRYFGASNVRPCLLPRTRNITVVNNTVNVTSITTVNNAIYNAGPSYTYINQRSGNRVRNVNLVREEAPGRRFRDGRWSRIDGDNLHVYAPRISRDRGLARPRSVRERISQPEIDRGWRRDADPALVAETRRKLRDEARRARAKRATAVHGQALAPAAENTAPLGQEHRGHRRPQRRPEREPRRLAGQPESPSQVTTPSPVLQPAPPQPQPPAIAENQRRNQKEAERKARKQEKAAHRQAQVEQHAAVASTQPPAPTDAGRHAAQQQAKRQAQELARQQARQEQAAHRAVPQQQKAQRQAEQNARKQQKTQQQQQQAAQRAARQQQQAQRQAEQNARKQQKAQQQQQQLAAAQQQQAQRQAEQNARKQQKAQQRQAAAARQ